MKRAGPEPLSTCLLWGTPCPRTATASVGPNCSELFQLSLPSSLSPINSLGLLPSTCWSSLSQARGGLTPPCVPVFPGRNKRNLPLFSPGCPPEGWAPGPLQFLTRAGSPTICKQPGLLSKGCCRRGQGPTAAHGTGFRTEEPRGGWERKGCGEIRQEMFQGYF